MKLAITNQNRTRFLTSLNGQYAWTDNPQLAYTFKSEDEAVECEEGPARDWLQFQTDVFSYVNDISDLL